jgi:hydroxymethylpyrimidine/phosphomethylpyrimidine kinase
MVSTSGSHLLQPDAVDALVKELIPLATVLTPNIREAGILLNRTVTRDIDDMKKAASEIWREKGSKYVLIKGGMDLGENNKETEITDILFDGVQYHEFKHDFIATKNTHGTGCTLSSAIAAFLARGHTSNRYY